MPIREFELPADLPVLIDVIPPSFQYPENEAWSIQADEVESMVDSLAGVQRMWPVMRVVRWLVPPMRDILRGYVWEEDGQPVGLVNVVRRGSTDRWLIGNVSVLPEYRRRGIARQLVAASMQYAHERGAQAITLDVLAGNDPAYRLYEVLGFEHYDTRASLTCEPDGPVDQPATPAGYTVVPSSMFDWRPRYELAQRITPQAVRRFVPVEEGRYKQPAILRPLFPLVRRAMGIEPYIAYVYDDSAQLVGALGATMRRHAGGVNEAMLALDPAHSQLAAYLVSSVLHVIQQESPGRRIELAVEEWQPSLIEAALAAGFAQRSTYHTMGKLLE